MFVSRIANVTQTLLGYLAGERILITKRFSFIYRCNHERVSYFTTLYGESRTYLLTYLFDSTKEVDFLHVNRMFAKKNGRWRSRSSRRINEISWFSCYSMLLVSFYIYIYMYSPFVDRSFHPAHGLLLFLFRGFVRQPSILLS